MVSAMCSFFAIPLGAAILSLVAWPFMRPKFGRSRTTFPFFGILWLDEEAKALLGRCARPRFLSRMREAIIEKRLGLPDDQDHDRLRLRRATWPKQASLICDGEFDELQKLQTEWRDDARYGAEGDDVSEQVEDATPHPFPNRWDVVWLAITLALLATAAASYFISRKLGCPVTEVRIVKIRTTETKIVDRYGPWSLDLLSDQIFDYNEPKLSQIQERRAVKIFERFFGQFQNVEIKRIEGFTDPIGTLCYNASLAQQRAEAIRELLAAYVASHPGRLTLASDLQVVGSGPGPEPDDVETWRDCRAATPELSRQYGGQFPFRTSDRSCVPPNADLQKLYPDALTPFSLARNRKVSDAAAMSQAQNQLMACVSPMRRVTISFSGKINSTLEVPTGS